jgi:hypothetical protein
LFATIVGGFAGVPTVTVITLDFPLIHSPFLQVAVYDVVVLGETVIDGVVAPVDQVMKPVQLFAVNVILPPLQTVFEVEFEVIKGAEITFTTTCTEFDFGLIQLSFILH